MGKKSDPPAPPPPKETAAAQTGSSIASAIGNANLSLVDQYGPDGSKTYNQVGTAAYKDPYTGQTYQIPRYSETTTLSAPAQQRQDTLNTAQQNMADIAKLLSSQVQDTAGRPVNADGLPALTTDFSADRQKVEDALLARMNPQLDRDRARLETDLANRGIRMGSTAYDRAAQNADQQSNDARYGAILNAGSEQSRLAALNSATRAQGLQERQALANEPINRLAALLSGSQVSQPQFQTVDMPNIANTDVASIIGNDYAARQQNWQAKQQQQAAMMGGLFDIGSSLITGAGAAKGFGNLLKW